MSRYSWLAALFLGLALLFTACMQTSTELPPEPEPEPALTGQLEIVVDGIAQADVVLQGNGDTMTETVSGSRLFDAMKPGFYVVDGLPVTNAIDPTPATVEVKAEDKTTVILTYVEVETTHPVPPITHLELLEVVDAGGDLPFVPEVNDIKDVLLFAAQTEEPVCVTVRATDAAGAPVEGGQLIVNIADGTMMDDRIAIIRGCGMLSDQAMTSAFRDGIFTGEDGLATFTLYAAFGTPDFDYFYEMFNQPAKVVVAAENKDGTAVLKEFKLFFFNLSHLYFCEYLDGEYVCDYTAERLGALFERLNIFDPDGWNGFDFAARIDIKQPQMPIEYIEHIGYMRFEIVEELSKGVVKDVVRFDGCDDGMTTGLNDVCHMDYDGRIVVKPNPGVGLEDLPIEATVKATLVVRVRYGREVYEFELKEFTVTKRWIGSYLGIDKTVDHHVLTWAGPEHHLFEAPEPNNLMDRTLKAKNDPAVAPDSVFTATYTITVTNLGMEPLYDLTVADALPAELGVIEDTFMPDGGTYDAVNHVVTWNFMAVADPLFSELPPGESIEVSLQVYLRQKPGFCMDYDDLHNARHYQIDPVGEWVPNIRSYCYEDPYYVVDGKEPEDVTATFYTGGPLGVGHQVKVDFNGLAHMEQVVIHGVRPIFSIEKTLIDPDQPMDVGEVAYFDIRIANLDRNRYDGLESAYPDEFTGPRYNPYGRNVQVKDVFDIGLDFVSATKLTVDGASYDVTPVPDKGILWDTVPLMNYRETGHARIALRANLVSGIIHKMAEAQCGGGECVPEPDYWWNCAFLDADNLNQPERVWNSDRDWEQLERRPWMPMPLHHPMHANLRYGIRDCEPVRVIPPPGEPWIELDTLSEFDGPDPNTATALPGVFDGDTYYYFFSVTNIGDEGADNVDLWAKLNCAGMPAQITPDVNAHTMWYSSDGGATWTFVDNADFAGVSGGVCTVDFPEYDLPFDDPYPVFLYSVEVTATASGDAHITAWADYTNPGLQAPLLPHEVVEDTSIAP